MLPAKLLRASGAILLAGALSGCISLAPLTTDYPIPVHGNPVNPTPLAGYRVECGTEPGLLNPLFNDYYSGCRQVLRPPYARAVVQTKG